jgi:mono/diheme cytochrome c family protein
VAGHAALTASGLGRALGAALLVGLPALAIAQAAPSSRGQLLYETHCIACHTTQMHWRANRIATDWTRLKALVWRWQAEQQLRWSDADVDEVARHLNERFYGHPLPGPLVSRAGAPPVRAAARGG